MSGPYFIVHSVSSVDGMAFVDGRLGDHTLKVGDVFDRSFASVDTWNAKSDGEPCALTVRRIEAYTKQLDELSPGMTARLCLSGSHLSALKRAAIIESVNQSEYRNEN